MSKTLNDLTDNDLGTRVSIMYTQVVGVLEEFDLDYEDEVRLVIDGDTYYLPREYPVVEPLSEEDYDPAVLLGVVDPWSPFYGL